MECVITDKKVIQKAIQGIVESNALISLDLSDFGNLNDILCYMVFKPNEGDCDFKTIINENALVNTKRIIVNTKSRDDIPLSLLEKVLSSLRKEFHQDIKILYGSTTNIGLKETIFEIFMIFE